MISFQQCNISIFYLLDYDLPRQGFLSSFIVPSMITPLKVSRNIMKERREDWKGQGPGNRKRYCEVIYSRNVRTFAFIISQQLWLPTQDWYNNKSINSLTWIGQQGLMRSHPQLRTYWQLDKYQGNKIPFSLKRNGQIALALMDSPILINTKQY